MDEYEQQFVINETAEEDDKTAIESCDEEGTNCIEVSEESTDDESDVLADNMLKDVEIVEIPFDPRKHLQHLTLNEMTRIVMNISDMIYTNTIQIPKNVSMDDFIYDIIMTNKLNIEIKRPINLYKTVVVNLSDLKINEIKLKHKLNKLFKVN